MLYITDYQEFGSESGERALDHISPQKPITHKQMILAYLKNGKEECFCASCIQDLVKKESTNKTKRFYTDGVYEWGNDETYHFEKYNLELNPMFIEHVLQKVG